MVRLASPPMNRAALRLLAAAALLSAWLVALLSGVALGGAIHLAAAAALAVFPWRAARGRQDRRTQREEEAR